MVSLCQRTVLDDDALATPGSLCGRGFRDDELARRRPTGGFQEFARVSAAHVAFRIAAEHTGDLGDAVLS